MTFASRLADCPGPLSRLSNGFLFFSFFLLALGFKRERKSLYHYYREHNPEGCLFDFVLFILFLVLSFLVMILSLLSACLSWFRGQKRLFFASFASVWYTNEIFSWSICVVWFGKGL